MEIACAGLSEEDEVLLYLRTLDIKPVTHPVNIIEIKKQDLVGGVICYKCGRPGHISTACRNEVPALADLRESFDVELEAVLAKITSERKLSRDAFGLHDVGDFLDASSNLETSVFCSNCGEAGHSYGACCHPNLDQSVTAAREMQFLPMHIRRRDFNAFWNS